MAQEILAVFGDRQLACGPVKQRAPHLLLQSPDLMADRGLGQVEPLGRAREPAGLADRNEGAQQCRLEIHEPNI